MQLNEDQHAVAICGADAVLPEATCSELMPRSNMLCASAQIANGAQRTNKEDRARTEGAELSKKYIAEEAKAHCKDFSS